MVKWHCNACLKVMPSDRENWTVVVPTAEGPVTVVLQAGEGLVKSPQFNTGGDAAICKRCLYLALQAEFAMEDVKDGSQSTHHRSNGAGRQLPGRASSE